MEIWSDWLLWQKSSPPVCSWYLGDTYKHLHMAKFICFKSHIELVDVAKNIFFHIIQYWYLSQYFNTIYEEEHAVHKFVRPQERM